MLKYAGLGSLARKQSVGTREHRALEFPLCLGHGKRRRKRSSRRRTEKWRDYSRTYNTAGVPGVVFGSRIRRDQRRRGNEQWFTRANVSECQRTISFTPSYIITGPGTRQCTSNPPAYPSLLAPFFIPISEAYLAHRKSDAF